MKAAYKKPRVPRRRPRPARKVSGKMKAIAGRGGVRTFQVNLLPEYLVSTNGSAAGVVTVTTDQTTPAPITATTQTTPDAAASALANMWSWGQALPFSISDLQNSGAFTTQYDYYRINSITVRVTYLSNSANVLSSGVMPTIYAYVDQDDAVKPTSQHDVIGRQGVKRFEFGNKSKTSFQITFKPKFKMLTGFIGGTVNITKPATGWLDCAYPQIQHYGLKMWYENFPLIGSAEGAAAPAMGLQYEFKYNLSFKDPINQF